MSTSSKEILSEGELDALMESVSSGDLPLDDGSGDTQCRPFDFATREQSLLAQMPGLKTVNEKHALGLARGIRELFRMPVEVEARKVDLVRLDDVLHAIPDPSLINVVRTLPLNGDSYLVISGELLSFLVDQYFGGTSGSQRKRHPGNDLTPTERRINEVLATRFLLTLQAAWADKISLTAELVSTESNPEFLQLAAVNEWAATFTFELTIAGWSSVIEWVVPYALLEPVRQKLASTATKVPARQGSADWETHIRGKLPTIELEVSAAFTSGTVSIAEILGLKKGSIIPLSGPNEVLMYVEGSPFCSGIHGAFNGNKSVKVTELLAPSFDITE